MDKLSIILKEVDDKINVVVFEDDTNKNLLNLTADEIILNSTVLKAPLNNNIVYPVIRYNPREKEEVTEFYKYVFKTAPNVWAAIYAFKYANKDISKNLNLFCTTSFVLFYSSIILKDDSNALEQLRENATDFPFFGMQPTEYIKTMLGIAEKCVDNVDAFEFEMLADIFELISKPSLLEYKGLIDIFGLYLLHPTIDKCTKKYISGKKLDAKTIGMIYYLIKTIEKSRGIFPDEKINHMVGELSIFLMIYDAQAIPFVDPLK